MKLFFPSLFHLTSCPPASWILPLPFSSPLFFSDVQLSCALQSHLLPSPSIPLLSGTLPTLKIISLSPSAALFLNPHSCPVQHSGFECPAVSATHSYIFCQNYAIKHRIKLVSHEMSCDFLFGDLSWWHHHYPRCTAPHLWVTSNSPPPYFQLVIQGHWLWLLHSLSSLSPGLVPSWTFMVLLAALGSSLISLLQGSPHANSSYVWLLDWVG